MAFSVTYNLYLFGDTTLHNDDAINHVHVELCRKYDLLESQKSAVLYGYFAVKLTSLIPEHNSLLT